MHGRGRIDVKRQGMSHAAPAVAAAMGLLVCSPSWAQPQDSELDFLLDTEQNTTTAPVDDPAPESNAPAATDESGDAQAVTELIPVEPLAEPPPESPVAQRSRSRLVEEIVVTAQKREENLQEVPISISAFSMDKLDASGVTKVQELDKVTPGLTFGSSFGYSIVFMRGIGTDAFLPSADHTVPIYVDGINQAVIQGDSTTLGRIDRVEVLKGPQGTLFGRNALGGAINVVTKVPNSDHGFFGDMKLERGNYNKTVADLYLNIPLGDHLAASLSGFSIEQDRFYNNEVEGVPQVDVYQRGGRLRLRWEPTERLWFDLGATLTEVSDTGSLIGENTRPSAVLGAALPRDNDLDRRVEHNTTGGFAARSEIFDLRAGLHGSWFDTKLLGSIQSMDVLFSRLDFDSTTLPIASFDGGSRTPGVRQFAEQATAELQFLSNDSTPGASWLQWVAGAYYLKSEAGLDPVIFQVGRDALTPTSLAGLAPLLDAVFGGLGLEPFSDGVTLVTKGILDTESLSFFAQGTVSLTDSLSLTLGGRYDEESRDLLEGLLGARNPVTGEIVTALRFPVDKVTTERFAPRAALSWFVTDEINLYTSYSIGYLSPTYNTANFTSAPDLVEQEKATAYEIGAKAILFGRALQLNVALFRTELDNIITGFFGLTSGGVVRFDNAGDGLIEGAEMDFQWLPMPDSNPGLGLSGSVSYLDARYTDYPNGRGFDEATGISFGEGTSPLPPRDFTGNRIVRTPKLSYTLGVSQTIALGDGEVEVGVDTYYNDGYFFSPQNSELVEQPRYQLLNARVGYLYAPWNLRVTVFGRNLTDKDYLLQAIMQEFGRTQTLAEPRTYGVTLNWSF
jgi:iron complex outermembrane recepter protein